MVANGIMQQGCICCVVPHFVKQSTLNSGTKWQMFDVYVYILCVCVCVCVCVRVCVCVCVCA